VAEQYPTPGPRPTLADLLATTYAELDSLHVEAVRVFDVGGVELFRSRPGEGTENEIAIADEALPLLRGAVVIHNHPSGWDYPPHHPMHNGRSFSQEDVFFAIEFDVLELQAVTPTWVYWLRRPDSGWGLPARAAQRRFVELVNDLAEEMLTLIHAGLLTVEEGEPELFHQAMVALVQEIGVGYGRWRRRTESHSCVPY
jgi:hypothetical protein